MGNQDSGKPGTPSRWSGASTTYRQVQQPPAPDPQVERLQSLARDAAAHLLRGRVDLARAPIEELATALPGNEVVQHLARQSAVIGFEWPLERTATSLAGRDPPRTADLDLVAFHVDLPLAPSGIHKPTDYASVLALSFESARIRAPAARRILLTDEHTTVPDSIPVDDVIRFPLDRDQLMYERMRVQTLYLERRAVGRASVLMDADVVVNLDPAPIFGEAFDVGLTWRPEFADAPFNGGMIFVAEGETGLRFLRMALACYDALADDPSIAALHPRGLRAWWGDQFALAAVVGYRPFYERTGEALSVDGMRVRFFPCETHNFTLEPTQYRTDELRRRFFIHFKGNRKALQSQYLEAMRAGKV
jgi:hypothetical protein